MTVQYTPFDLIQKIMQNNYSYTHSYTKKITEADENVEKLQDKVGKFKKSVQKLKRYSAGSISKDLLESQAEDLVKTYNDMKNSSAKVTDPDVQKQITKLEKLFTDNEKSLKKIGIEKVNGKYTFDSKTFQEASDKRINELFIGHDSFIGQADRIMHKIEDSTEAAQYVVSNYKISRTQDYDAMDMVLAADVILAEKTTAAMEAVPADKLSDNTVQNSVSLYLGYFAKSVYHPDSGFESTDALNQLCHEYEEKLAKLGLTFRGDPEKLSFNDSIDMTTPDFQNTYNELFGKNATFGNKVLSYCKDIFAEIVQPDKIGVSIIDAQA